MSSFTGAQAVLFLSFRAGRSLRGAISFGLQLSFPGGEALDRPALGLLGGSEACLSTILVMTYWDGLPA